MGKKAGLLIGLGLIAGTTALVVLGRKPPELMIFGTPSLFAERCILSNYWDVPVFSCEVRNPYGEVITMNVSLFRLEKYNDGRETGPTVMKKQGFTINPGSSYRFEWQGENNVARCEPNLQKNCVTSFWLEDEEGNQSQIAKIEQ